MPGNVIDIAPGLKMGIAYDSTRSGYRIRLKFWAHGQRTKDYFLDNNRQMDLRHICKRLIVLFSTTFEPGTTHPVRSHFVIEERAPA